MNQPVQKPNIVQPEHRHVSGNSVHHNANIHKKSVVLGVIISVAIVLSAIGGYFIYRHFASPSLFNVNQYQAVFLNNGQVYFGKVAKATDGYLTISDTFYLQTQTSQSDATTAKDVVEKTDAKGDFQLIKLGEELHAPDDTMIINKDQVLFIENMKDNGKIVQAIKTYKAK